MCIWQSTTSTISKQKHIQTVAEGHVACSDHRPETSCGHALPLSESLLFDCSGHSFSLPPPNTTHTPTHTHRIPS